jgi:hypothetical protein
MVTPINKGRLLAIKFLVKLPWVSCTDFTKYLYARKVAAIRIIFVSYKYSLQDINPCLARLNIILWKQSVAMMPIYNEIKKIKIKCIFFSFIVGTIPIKNIT